MARLDEIIDDLRSEGRVEDAEELEKLRGSSLRKKAEAAEKWEREYSELKGKLEKLESIPVREKAFKDYGIDVEGLSKAERKILEGYDGELDAEAIGALVEEYELPVSAQEGETGPETEAQRVTTAARRADQGRGGKAPVLKPEDVAEWSMEKKVGFADANPEAWEALKRGEAVPGVTP